MLRSERLRIGLVSVVVFLTVWELAGRLEWIDPLFISYPTEALVEGWGLISNPKFVDHLSISFTEFALGTVAAIVTGIPLGLALGRFRRFNQLFEPLVMAFYTTPRLALLPLFIIWMGIGIYSKAAVVFLGAFFSLVISVSSGLKEVNPLWVQAARSFGADELSIFRHVMLPGTLPYLFTGLRIGLGRALMGVVIAEMYVSSVGIGNLIMQTSQSFRTGRLIFLTVLVAAFGYLLVGAVQFIEKSVVRWHREIQEA